MGQELTIRERDLTSIERNEFAGDELIHYLVIARRLRTDVYLGVDQNGCGWIEDDRTPHFRSDSSRL